MFKTNCNIQDTFTNRKVLHLGKKAFRKLINA